ncbi:MAG TPA: metallophosphoesterase [Kofleriaceae bacterium]
MRILGVALLVLAACANSGKDGGGGGGIDGGGGGGDTVMPDAPEAPKAVKFIALGDTGKGNADQRRVAIAMRDLCAAKGCDFVIMLGDNIYDSGVESTTDPQWQTKFEQPYMDVNLPFYVALGNHDYGGNLIIDVGGLGNEFDKGPIEVQYTQVSTKWNMPATHYTFTWGDVGFIVLDTNSILWSNTEHGDQATWLPSALAQVAGKRWIFTAGHHPYLSNGTHGNAGDYDAPELEGIQIPNPLPIQNGDAVKEFFDDHVCGISQVYFAGHDHTRQWMNEPTALCGTEMIVSGAGASTTEIRNRGNGVFYEDASKPGFMYVVIDGDKFTGEFYDANGAMDFSRTFTR